MQSFQLTVEHNRWAKNRRKSYRGTTKDYLDVILRQEGRCAFSGVSLFFGKTHGGGYIPGGSGCHPLYAVVDHSSPGNFLRGFQIVCFALNDLKGHLPLDCFLDLRETASWRRLMIAWQKQAEFNSDDRQAFRDLLRL